MNYEAALRGADAHFDRVTTPRFRVELRRIHRLVRLGVAFARATFDFLILVRWDSMEQRARWLSRWCRVATTILGMEIEYRGSAPRSGLIVANHVSYLDILALAAVTPCLFVAKCEVAHWPILGAFARMGGTVFIDRSRRRDVLRVNSELARLLDLGLPIVLFPEGTSSDGRDVLPFKTSLFQPVCGGTAPVSPVAVDYAIAGHSMPEIVSYWGNRMLLPHLLKILGVEAIEARLEFASSKSRVCPRKLLAALTRCEILRMRSAR